jgi:uncharacterized protein (DUF362 family)
MRCDDYDPHKIARIVSEGMETLEVIPTGRILLKPNTVIAHPEVFPHAFTRKEFLDGVISATKTRAENPREISVGERSGIILPTRYNFKNAGYNAVMRKHKIKTYYFDEVPQVPVEINGTQNLRTKLFIPRPLTQTDFLINLPKFKAHPWCRLTLSLKNYIGIQDDRHRLVDHNPWLEHKIADLQEIIQPKFIAIDGVIAGQRMMLTPTPFHLGAIIMGVNSCAVDTVGCHMVHVDPGDLIHLRLAAERGFGPMDLDEIEVGGDFPLDEVREKTVDFQFCMERVDDYFGDDSNLSCTVGEFPEAHSPDYCWGGCPGAIQEAMHIFRGFYPDVDKNMQKTRCVIGRVDGPLHTDEDERIIFVGSCTNWKGRIDGQDVTIESSYKQYRQVDESKTRSNDMLLKTFKALWHIWRNRSSKYIHARGCTLSVAEVVNYLSGVAKIKNPHFKLSLLIPLNMAYWQMRFHRFFYRLFG